MSLPEELPPALFFEGDTGELPLETRRVLVQLLAGPSLDGQRHSKLWPILSRDEVIIRSRLGDLFLELVIDREMQVAFTRQLDTGELETPSLLRRAQLTFIDSIILLHLRQRLTQAHAEGERGVIATDDIVEYMTPYERNANTDRAGFKKRIDASIEKMKKHGILRRMQVNTERFEISPTLKLLFSAAEVQALTALYRQMDPKNTEDLS